MTHEIRICCGQRPSFISQSPDHQWVWKCGRKSILKSAKEAVEILIAAYRQQKWTVGFTIGHPLAETYRAYCQPVYPGFRWDLNRFCSVKIRNYCPHACDGCVYLTAEGAAHKSASILDMFLSGDTVVIETHVPNVEISVHGCLAYTFRLKSRWVQDFPEAALCWIVLPGPAKVIARYLHTYTLTFAEWETEIVNAFNDDRNIDNSHQVYMNWREYCPAQRLPIKFLYPALSTIDSASVSSDTLTVRFRPAY